MTATPRDKLLSVDEYLAQERLSEIKHEYIDGRLYAMAGATHAHNTIAGNAYVLLRTQLRGGACQVFMADMRVRPLGRARYFYPDLFVTCDPRDRQRGSEESKHHPLVIIEVLSDSTADFDREEKFGYYREFPSLREYVLIHTAQHRVDTLRRIAPSSDLWESRSYGPDEELVLTSIDFRCSIATLYENAALADLADPEL